MANSCDGKAGMPSGPEENGGFRPSGQPKNLDDRGSVVFEGGKETNEALKGVGGSSVGSAKRFSSVLSEGPVQIRTE